MSEPVLQIKFNTPLSKACRIGSLLVTFGFFVLKSAAFVVAWSSPYKIVITAINEFGEANTELVMIFILLPVVTIGLIQNLVISYRLDTKGTVRS
jgi:hypothetical protein